MSEKHMRASAACIKVIQESEGCRLTAYVDPAGVLTVGYGHTGPDVHAGMCIDDQKALELLDGDLQRAEAAVNRLVSVPLTQGQFDALADFVFNLGPRRLAESTLLQKLNAGDSAGASREFPNWCKAGGRVLPGLLIRREKEQALFNA